MITTGLEGPPGSGKSTMAALTAVNRPVHFLDLDRKIASMANLRAAIEKGDVTFDEFRETIAEEGLETRLSRLAKDQKPQTPPAGWASIARMIEGLPKNEKAKAAGTIVIDSWSFAVDHIVQRILYDSSATNANAVMNSRQWGQLLQINKEAITVAIDVCRFMEKDLIVTIHERAADVPGSNTKVIKTSDGTRSFIGQMEMKIVPSIPGQFGHEMARYFVEFYGLEVKMVDDKPKWICRVKPDGKRDLRTSFAVGDKAEFNCDFREIWK